MNRLPFILLVMLPLYSVAQTGYRIDFTVNGLRDTTAYLGYFLQEKTFVKDTAMVDHDGAFSFTGKQSLPEGLYFLVVNKNRLFDFVIGKDQQFGISTSLGDHSNLKIIGDEDNEAFFENMRLRSDADKDAEPFLGVLRDSTRTEVDKKEARAAFDKINERVMARQQDIIDTNPNAVTARLLKMNKPVTIPDAPVKSNGKIDSTFQLRYYREHYFDNFDLSDEALLRLPKVFYWEKVQDYLSRLYVQHPDTIANAIYRLVDVAKTNKETYKYLVWNCVVNYMNPEVMGLDQVFVALVDRYIVSGEMDYWLDKKTIQNLKNEAAKIRRARIGSTAPNMTMQDQNLQPRSLYDLKNRYTILFFFKPSCGHCREETPKLVSFFNANKNKYDLGVFAVATDTSMQEMKKFITEFKTPWTTVNGPRSYSKTHFSDLYYADQTPMVYITDEKKKIIARKIAVSQIGDFLANYEEYVVRPQP